jgi:hypothetical protein
MRLILHKKRIGILVYLLVIFALITAGCATPTQVSINELFSPTPSLTPIATIDWFPATVTPTFAPLQTVTPNPAASPVYEQLDFSDSFAQTGSWMESQTSTGLVIVQEGALTLAVKSTRGSLLALRQNTQLTNDYIQVTMNKLAFCTTDDQIGVVFRAQDEQNFYRLLISCQGQFSVQQVVNGTPSFLVGWSLSNEIPANLWKPLQIGIWTYGNTLRIYFNDKLQSETSRETFKSGTIGFYARAASESPLTVGFSALKVYQVVGNPSTLPEITTTP